MDNYYNDDNDDDDNINLYLVQVLCFRTSQPVLVCVYKDLFVHSLRMFSTCGNDDDDNDDNDDDIGGGGDDNDDT